MQQSTAPGTGTISRQYLNCDLPFFFYFLVVAFKWHPSRTSARFASVRFFFRTVLPLPPNQCNSVKSLPCSFQQWSRWSTGNWGKTVDREEGQRRCVTSRRCLPEGLKLHSWTVIGSASPVVPRFESTFVHYTIRNGPRTTYVLLSSEVPARGMT